jgi:DNA-directed RNA polymerase subunit E"
MARKKANKDSKLIVDANVDRCPLTGSNNFTTIFQGRVCVLDPEKSQVAQRMEYKQRGEYAIKVRG